MRIVLGQNDDLTLQRGEVQKNVFADMLCVSQKGQANGVASLGEDGKVPLSQIPVQETTVIDNNGHEYVDLALPSGTLWAKWNLREGTIDNPDIGYHYAYGQFQNGCVGSTDMYIGTENPLDKGFDVAYFELGGGWHIPYDWQLRELFALPNEYVQQYEDTETGVTINKPGRIFTGSNGHHIFIPFVGRLDTLGQHEEYPTGDEQFASLLCATYDAEQYSLTNEECLISDITEYDIPVIKKGYREVGYSIRPCLEATVVQKLPVGDQLKDDALIDDYSYYNGSTLVENQRGRILSPNVMYDLDLTQSEDNTSYGMTFLLPIMNDDGVLYKTGYVPQTSPDFTHGQVWQFMFTAPSSGTMPTLTLLSGVSGASIVWKDTLTIEAGKTYEISVVYNKRQNKYYASACAFTNS